MPGGRGHHRGRGGRHSGRRGGGGAAAGGEQQQPKAALLSGEALLVDLRATDEFYASLEGQGGCVGVWVGAANILRLQVISTHLPQPTPPPAECPVSDRDGGCGATPMGIRKLEMVGAAPPSPPRPGTVPRPSPICKQRDPPPPCRLTVAACLPDPLPCSPAGAS